MIDEVEQGGQGFFVPELELLVSAGVHKPLIVGIRHTEPVQIHGCDFDEIALCELRIDIRLTACRIGDFGQLSDEYAAGRNERHRFVELADCAQHLSLR